jgi:KRAB domain-containing zinc finger protein
MLPCEYCQKVNFKDKYARTIHVRKHTGERPFKCDICDYAGASVNLLNTHKRVHRAPEHICEICSAGYISKATLKKHVESHSRIKPPKPPKPAKNIVFKCRFCDFKSNIFQEKVDHSKKHSFECPECDRCFDTYSKYVNHMKRHIVLNKIFKETSDKILESLDS